MVHESGNSGYTVHVPRLEDTEMITVGHPDAELLKVFLHKHEKQALKEFAANKGVPMYHLVRGMIIELLEQQEKSI